MNNDNKKISPISIITPEQIIFTKSMIDHFYNTSTDFAKSKYLCKCGVVSKFRYEIKEIWVKHDLKQKNEIWKNVGLCIENSSAISKHFKDGEIKQFKGIIPTIPCKHIIDYANKISDKFYEFGFFPNSKLDISFFKNQNLEIENVFKCTGEKFSFPRVENKKIVIKPYNVYEFNGIKAIKYEDGIWYKVEPVKWEKRGEYFISNKILFQLPLHIVELDNGSLSFDDTFLKFYLDNFFAKELVQGTNYAFSSESVLLDLDDQIKSKTAEIERLQQIREYIIKNLNSEELENTQSEQDISSKKL